MNAICVRLSEISYVDIEPFDLQSNKTKWIKNEIWKLAKNCNKKAVKSFISGQTGCQLMYTNYVHLRGCTACCNASQLLKPFIFLPANIQLLFNLQ